MLSKHVVSPVSATMIVSTSRLASAIRLAPWIRERLVSVICDSWEVITLVVSAKMIVSTSRLASAVRLAP
jgi:hypothetical protein